MAEAILLRNLPDGLGEVYVWKKYEVVENVSYKWNRWNVVETVTYKWEKWNTAIEEKQLAYYQGIDPGDGTESVPYGNAIYMYSTYGSTYKISDSYYISGSEFRLEGSIKDILVSQSLVSDRNFYCIAYKEYDGTETTVYVAPNATSGRRIFRMPNGNSGSHHGKTSWIHYSGYLYGLADAKGSTSYGQVTSTNSAAYPSNGISGSYWYVSAGSSTSYSKGSTLYSSVSSTSSSAYPNPGHQDGYWYENRQQVITYSMGSYIEDVFSTNPQRYPTNGMDGAYWYVLQS